MFGNWRAVFCGALLAAMTIGLSTRAAAGQLLEPGTLGQGTLGQGTLDPGTQTPAPNPLTDTTVRPGQTLLFSLEAQFAKDVAARGGPGFASWFAGDGVLLGNGAAPVEGKVAIEKYANWSPTNYQLTWTPVGAAMGPSGEVGYTWSDYVGHSKGANGQVVTTSGRFITIWRKQAGGSWKVALDAGADAPAGAGSCCQVPVTH